MLILISSIYANNAFGEKFDKKSCITNIPKDASSVEKNKMRRDCENRETGAAINKQIETEKNLSNSPYEGNRFEKSLGVDMCSKQYSAYKKLGEKKFRENFMKILIENILNDGVFNGKRLSEKDRKILTDLLKDTSIFTGIYTAEIDQCIDIYKSVGDPANPKNHAKLKQVLTNQALKDMAPSKSVGNIKTPDLEELEKRINKKLEKLEKENKQLKEQLKKLKTNNSKWMI